MRKHRYELGLFQREAAVELGVTVDAVLDWEKDRAEPETRYWPKIVAFLGYDPTPEPKTLGERLWAKYRELGIPRKEAARLLGLDEMTLQRYEEEAWQPGKRNTAKLEWFLALAKSRQPGTG